MTAAWALQQAMFAALSADAALAALLGRRLYDAVPPNAAFPYLVLGEGQESAEDDSTQRHALTLHIWSRAAGLRESKTIAAAVTACLAGPVAVSGFLLISLRCLAADYARQSDGKTLRATLRFTALTETA